MNVIEVDNVSKMFRLGAHTGDLRERFSSLFSREKAAADRKAQEFWALQDISFSVAEGESFGIIGHNGSGKSTLLKLITGIYKPTTGAFKTRGRIAALIEVGAGFHPDLTGRENVYLNGSVLGMTRREIDKKFDEIVAFAELERFIDTPVKRYSSGMYMRLGFSIAAHINPDIVLVDEVLAVGDESFQSKCMDKMKDLRRSGKTIVFISHSMDAVAALCETVMLLSHGEMLAIGGPGKVISAYRTSLVAEHDQKVLAAEVIDTAALKVAPMQKELEIIDVRLVDLSGQPCDTIEIGDAIRLECKYRANGRVDDLAIGLNLSRSDGFYVSGLNTNFDEVMPAPVNGEARFAITFPSVQLLQGVYSFNVGLCHRDDTHHPVDLRQKAARLTVIGSCLDQGLLVMPHTWDVDNGRELSSSSMASAGNSTAVSA